MGAFLPALLTPNRPQQMNSITNQAFDRDGGSIMVTPDPLAAVLFGGLVAGVLDALDAQIAFGLLGSTPLQIYQFVASGALGPGAFQGGLGTALLGLGFHFFIAFALAAFFYLVTRLVPRVTQHWVAAGLLYGVGAYFVMSYIVLPHSAAPKSPFSWPLFFNGVIGHAIFVGLPIAWFAARSARAQSK